MAIARRWHEQCTSRPCRRPHPPSPSTMPCCLPQCSPLKLNATKLTTRSRLQEQEQQAMRCTTMTHDDSVEHAHVHALPLSITGSSMLMPPSPASLPHAPAYNDLELSIIPLFVASSSSLLSLSVARSCTTGDLGTAAATTTQHVRTAENSTLDSLTGDNHNFMYWGSCLAAEFAYTGTSSSARSPPVCPRLTSLTSLDHILKSSPSPIARC
ncbi:hypothetical protein F5148DRAFT_595511 [Russula earlei]|uniref:Uncharacterized protein n=1 Tax=Russula earlei TaxID=71964 RepID=A0ACC0TV59_9AGAM|nr:hypothetical protein F5148DRAFT_595511 [Russula earlei]